MSISAVFPSLLLNDIGFSFRNPRRVCLKYTYSPGYKKLKSRDIETNNKTCQSGGALHICKYNTPTHKN